MLLAATDNCVLKSNKAKGEINVFNENLKTLRKQKGLSQEELSERLHVVRQTISKWEKGLSVPDAETLIKISEVFEVPVSELIGETIDIETEKSYNKIIAEKLEQLNISIAERNRRSRKIWKVVIIVLVVIVDFTLFAVISSIIGLHFFSSDPKNTVESIEEIASIAFIN